MTRANRAIMWADRHVVVWVAALTLIVVGLLAATVIIALTAAKTAAASARQEAVHEAGVRATYTSCLTSRPALRAISRHVVGVNALAAILVENSRASIAAAPKHDPLAVTRRKNLVRLERARAEVGAVKGFPVPSEAQCAARSGIPDAQRHR